VSPPHRVRLAPCLTAVLEQVHPTNASAAHRALLLLGAHAAGYDLTGCAAEVHRVLAAAGLSDQTRQALVQALAQRRTDVGQVSYNRRTDVGHLSYADLPDADGDTDGDTDGDADPLAGIGFDV